MKKGDRVSAAPLWRRTCAYIIDMLIISVFILLPLSNLYPEETTASWKESISMMKQGITKTHIIVSLIMAIVTILYWALLEYKLSQTPGKMLMKIKVSSLTSTLSFKQCFVRNITKISFPLLLLDTVYMAKSKSQRFFDRLAETEIVMQEQVKVQKRK